MLSPSRFYELVGGRRRGAWPSLLRLGLRLAEVPYTCAVRWRNRRYDSGATVTHRVEVPVVSVGNLTLGGTGKTPMVEWIARWFRRRDVRVTVISRGYGAQRGSQNDEALELEQKLPDVPHLQNPDRVAAARVAIDELDCQLILLDDGFQHRRLGRDLDIVLVDATEPFGFGHVFPRGMLREPIDGLRRADVVVLSRADSVTEQRKEQIAREIRRHAPEAVYAEGVHAPRGLIAFDGREEPLDSLRDQPVAAFCGIGNPGGFRHTLETCGCRVIAFREFPDHHAYDRADVEALTEWTESLQVTAVLCTHKDLVKLGIERLGNVSLRAVTVGMDFLGGEQALENKLQALLA